MKYPQLVSPRAVNAISDWLVSRLEQLGVESPQIYTRLLLSLLQSSVQVNDPIEFSNLETFFANRKGGHKRFHLPSDTETLKKLNAVQCLREIVSNEQETATIEQLVDELCEKLKDIEKQTQNLSDEERFLIETHLDTDTILQNQHNTQLQNPQQATSSNYNNTHYHTRHHHQQQQQHTHYHHHHNHHNHPNPQQQQQDIHNSNKSNSAAINLEAKRQHVLSTSSTSTSATKTDDALNDLDNDPKKRYFRAFPALSKEMEDSFRIWRRNAKSLTWPLVGRSIVVDNLNNSSASLSSSSASSIISSSNFGANTVSTDKSAEKKLKGVGHQLENKVNTDISGSGHIGGSDVQHQQQLQGAVAASAKKKSKRRRNQALCKGKTIQNLRKLSVGTTSNSVGGNKYHQYTHQRNSSPAWDTDFKGCWEMGPDLIKDFLSRQNGKKRNRSHSAASMVEPEEHNEHEMLLNEMPAKNDENPLMKRYIDLSFCYEDDDEINDHDTQHQCTEEGVDYVDEDYDDNTLASVSELTMDNFNPKRLYQREGGRSTKKSLAFGGTVVMGHFSIAAENTLEDSVDDSLDPLDFQQFKAKFNSGVEALWKDVETTTSAGSSLRSTNLIQSNENSLKLSNPLGSGISSAFYATTSLNALAPFKNDLWNFWSNYQQHDFDEVKNKLPPTTASTSSMLMTTRLDDNSAGSGAGADVANSSDYFSMPSNLNDFDKSVGSVRRTNETGASLGAHTPSINVFLRNSIWSTSDDCVDALGSTSATTTAADTDESFLFKVWHSNKKLSELDVGNGVKGEKMTTLVVDNDGVNGTDFNKAGVGEPASIMVNSQNLGANLQFPPYQNLKWSEGINAGPPYSSLRTHPNVNHHNDMQSINSNNNTCLRNENNYASFSSVASLSGATWEAPAFGQNAQPDLKSWCASNPISLTEMYGNDVCDSIVNQPPEEEPEPNQAEIVMGPAVTLPNHCAQTSGFLAYSCIKQSGLIKPQVKPLEFTNNAACLPKEFFRSGEEENLLTSERTHFHPIENFVDGHTFDINNSVDTIEFERTSSGLMCHESEEYLEYTRNDIYMADEEVATHSTNLLKYGRKANEDKDKKDAFIIKFRVKRSEEIACQTDEQDLQLAATKMAELPTTSKTLQTIPPSLAVNNMFHNTFSLSRQANNEAIMAAVNKAVAAAAKAAAENRLSTGHFCWLANTNTKTDPSTTANAKNANTGETNPLWRPDNSICDEVDFCQMDCSIKEQQQQLAKNWSMQEVEKQCHQRRCLPPPPELEINRQLQTKTESELLDGSEENSLDNTSLHTLWGMCAVCNSCDFDKSMPANRLLRDELQIEADEIMSDLRYMQDLYIGESNILSDNNEEDSTSGHTDLATDDKMFDYLNKDFDKNSMKDSWNMMDVKETKSHQHEANQISMLQKVNQLIEGLLKPDNTVKLQKERNEQEKINMQTPISVNDWNVQEREHDKRKNLWQFSEQKDDNNIWQTKTLTETEPNLEEKLSKRNEETFANPLNLRKEVEDTQETQTLNWQHDNLAKIWQPIKTTNAPIDETVGKHKQNEMANEILNENLQIQQQQENSLDDSLKFVEEKNLKNLQNTNDLTAPTASCSSSSSSTTLTYKRVQQFLNNSAAAKMKLAANRKRRHSASQNFYQQQHLQHYGNNNNNNSDGITNLNAYKRELNDTFEIAKQTQHQLGELTNYNEASSAEEQPTKQTIITCKYWTAATNGTQTSLDSAAAAMMLLAAATNANHTTHDFLTNTNTAPALDNCDQEDVMLDENVFGNTTFSCLINKNASILKHVTMMTRPLTR